MERSQCLVSDVVDKEQEEAHIKDALRKCSYPKWSFDIVKNQMQQRQQKTQKKQDQLPSRSLVVIPYVERTSEAAARIMRK